MKQKDIALIAVIAIISGIFSIVLSNALIAPKKNRLQKAEVVDVISSDFNTPDTRFFNKDTSLNPTKKITIGDNGNNTPFNDNKKN